MRLRSFALLVLVVPLVVGLGPALPAGAEAVTIDGPIALRAEPGGVIDLADHGSYRGSIEVHNTGGGLTVINEVTLEEYVKGIREIPGKWPMEALRAQAVAARTYALWEKRNGRWTREGFDICPTAACQVYTGADAEDREHGARWVEAVRSTAGEVLVAGDRPALARYHASSGGRTLPNHTVYGGAIPYLTGIEDPDDAISPLNTWTADFPHPDLEAILREAFGFEGALVGVGTDREGRRAVVHAEDGVRTVDIMTLRNAIVEHAPRLFPERYPGPRNDGQRMPVTLPSARFDVTPIEGGFRFHGRGYGHGVGMSQWGAMGRAQRGESYRQILAAYYGGLQPVQWPQDEPIRVRILETVDELHLSPEGEARVFTLDGALEREPGTWVLRPGPDGTLAAEAPPRAVQAAEEDRIQLAFGILDAPQRVEIDPQADVVTIPVTFSVTKPARVEAALIGEGGESVALGGADVGVGSSRLTLDVDTPIPDGPYRLELRAADAETEVLADHRVTLVALDPPAPEPEPAPRPVPEATGAVAMALAGTLLGSRPRLERALGTRMRGDGGG